VVHKIP